MEDVLDLYAEPPDPQRPVVCLDEKLVTLHADIRPSLPVAPGRSERIDYEYERVGTANLFVMVDPHAGWRHIAVTDRRCATDYARQLHWLADECYPDADMIRLVQDNLNTHHLSSLYLVYPPDEARRIAKRFEIHSTPKHGSWLDMAEIEIGIVERSCLRRRVANREELQARIRLLEQERNAARCQIHWRFTTPDARTKLSRFYDQLLAPASSKN
jgi:DDE superfamily endonuclease